MMNTGQGTSNRNGEAVKKNGIKRLKSGSLPAKADSQKQRGFYHRILKPLMDRAKGWEISLLFLDASHFVMGSHVTHHR